jgi:sulfite oxidase
VEVELAGQHKETLPVYTLADVAKHATKDDRIWVTYGLGVYDITDFVDEHPGGDKILMAAGGSLEPFWLLYAVHKNADVFALLEQFRIGW